MKLEGKIIVVTGAGSGMGRQVALEAVRRGARVATVDMNEATLAETAGLAGSPERLSTHVLDITDRAAVGVRRTLPADKAARMILDGMERNAYRVMVGSDAKRMDRLYRLDPRRAAGFIAGRMKDLLPADGRDRRP